MRRSFLSALTVALVFCLVTLALFSFGLPPSRALAQGPAGGPDDLLARVALAAGRDPAGLVIAEDGPVTLMDGRTLWRVKAADPATGEAIQATFDGDTVVDEAAVRAQVAADWRAAHGAANFVLVRALADMGPADTVDVALWLVADVEPLPEPEHIYTPDPADLSSAGPLEEPPETLPEGSFTIVDGRRIALPIPWDRVPPEVMAAVGMATLAQPSDPAQQAEPDVEKPAADYTPSPPDTLARVEAAQKQKALNDAHIRDQIAPVQKQAMDQLISAGLAGKVTYASESAPLVYLTGVTRREVEAMAFWPSVDTLYLATNQGGPALGIARPTQNANLLESVGGYTGLGVDVAVVEGELAYTLNPYLTIAGVRDGTRSSKDHPTAVSGMIRSTHSGVRGLAPGVDLYSANGDDYATWAATEAAMDWGAAHSNVQNNSHWMGTSDVDAPQAPDRHLDYIARALRDLPVAAAGNFNGANCLGVAGPGCNYVVSPGKGYNTLTVGNYDDHDSLSWTGDSMDPASDYNHSGRWKPEVAATGHGISSTTRSAPWVADRGSGTSYSAPMVTALAADLMQIEPALVGKPEVLKAIIMATALHNIEGDARLSRVDGAGGIDASAAAVVAEEGRWDSRVVGSGTTFPITFTVFARQNERVRFVTTWLSNPSSSPYATDPQPVDLDVTAYRADGTTVVGASNNGPTNLEIIDFNAPAAETYQISLRFGGGSWSGNTWLGSAWFRGPHRISPETGYADPKAPPMGTHLAVLPSSWSYSNHWRAFGIRSASGTDHDLTVRTASLFDDPSTRSTLASSAYGAGSTDFIAVDGNHRASSDIEQYQITFWGGASSGYDVSRSATGVTFSSRGLYGPFSMSSSQVVKSFDVYFAGGATRRVAVVPDPANANDLALALFKSDPASSGTWVKARSGSVAARDAYTVTTAVELVAYTNSGAADWLGLVVHGRNQAYSQFYILIADYAIFLPMVRR